jgi:hypothetical protein
MNICDCSSSYTKTVCSEHKDEENISVLFQNPQQQRPVSRSDLETIYSTTCDSSSSELNNKKLLPCMILMIYG